MDGYRTRDHRRYRRAVGRAFSQVTFYREQCAAAGSIPSEPVPVAVAELPQPPHALCAFARPWLPEREPSLWTAGPSPLARALRLAGCAGRRPVLEVREALLDRARLRIGVGYQVLLSPTALVASQQHRRDHNTAALAAASGGWLVGSPQELAELSDPAPAGLRPVHRLPVAALGEAPAGQTPQLIYEPTLGYLGARAPECGRFHLDRRRVYARQRGEVVTFSLPGSRRPTLLALVPAGAQRVRLARCDRHGGPVLDPQGG